MGVRLSKTGQIVQIVALLIILCIGIINRDSIGAALNKPVNEDVILAAQQRSSNILNDKTVDSCVRLLKSGDLVVRTGTGISSYMLCTMNQYDKTYSHCGIVAIENGYPFVYHSIGGEDNPDARVRRDSANFFFSPYNNMGFGIARYDLNEAGVNKLLQKARQYYIEKRKFDMDFDLKTDDRLYCAELVYKALLSATGDSTYVRPTRVMGYTFVGVDNLYLSPHAKLICQIKFK